MREMVAPFYWAAAGALAGFGLIGLMTIGGPFLLAGAVLALAGLILLRTKGVWALFVGFGGLPALVFPAAHIQRRQDDAEPVLRANGGPGALVAGAADPGPVSVSCSFVPASYYVMFAVFAVVALFGVALGRLLRRTGRRAASS